MPVPVPGPLPGPPALTEGLADDGPLWPPDCDCIADCDCDCECEWEEPGADRPLSPPGAPVLVGPGPAPEPAPAPEPGPDTELAATLLEAAVAPPGGADAPPDPGALPPAPAFGAALLWLTGLPPPADVLFEPFAPPPPPLLLLPAPPLALALAPAPPPLKLCPLDEGLLIDAPRSSLMCG